MAVIGELAVNVVARTKKFADGMKKAQRQAGLFERSMRKLGAGGVAAIAAAGFATVKLASSLGNAAANMDKIAKTASKLGMSTRQLVGLQHAAGLTGVSAETLNMALQRMVRRINEASRGTGEAKDAIKGLGLSAAALVQLDPAEQFRQIADAMQKTDNRSRQLADAMKLFDSEGVALVNTLDLGSKGLKKMLAEADRLGKTFSPAQAAKIEAMNDALSKFGDSFDKAKNEIIINVAPAVTRVMGDLAEIVAYLGRQGSGGASASDRAYDAQTRSMSNFNPRKWYRVNVAVARKQNERYAAIAGQQDLMVSAAAAAKQREEQRKNYLGPIQPNNPTDLESSRSGARSHSTRKSQGMMRGAFSMLRGIGGRAKGAMASAASTINQQTMAMATFNAIKGRQRRQMSEAKSLPEVRQNNNTILEKGTREAFRALRANMGGSDKKTKLDELRNKHLAELTSFMKTNFALPAVKSVADG